MYDTHIFLDFEMNPIPREFKEERSLCHAEICEIGAVKLDAEYRVVGRFSQVVRPHYAPYCTTYYQADGHHRRRGCRRSGL